jgi:hypothetical protein
MRARVVVPAAVVLTLGLTACATVGRIGLPAPSPPPVRAAEVAPPAPASASARVAPPLVPLSPQPELPPPPPAPPAPTLVKPPPTAMTPAMPSAPAVPSSPVAPSPPGAAPPAAPPAPPPRILGQQVSSEDEKRIQGDAQRRIDRTERLVKQIDQPRLVGDQAQNLLTVQSFLVKAREALSEKDVQRALTLADKAFLLAEELVKAVR